MRLVSLSFMQSKSPRTRTGRLEAKSHAVAATCKKSALRALLAAGPGREAACTRRPPEALDEGSSLSLHCFCAVVPSRH